MEEIMRVEKSSLKNQKAKADSVPSHSVVFKTDMTAIIIRCKTQSQLTILIRVESDI